MSIYTIKDMIFSQFIAINKNKAMEVKEKKKVW